MFISFSMMFSGRVKRDAKGPSALSICLRFLVSVLLMAPIRVAVVVYVVRKINAPTISFIQLNRLS